MMSFQNLGKVSRFLNGSVDSIDDISIDKIAKAMHTLGLDETSIWQALWDTGDYDVDTIEKAINSLKKSGKFLGEVFANAKDRVGNFFTGLISSPKGIATIAAVSVAVIAATAAIIAYNQSFDKLLKDAEESKSAYDETISEVDSLESSLSSVQSRIEALQAQGPLSIAEEKEPEITKHISEPMMQNLCL